MRKLEINDWLILNRIIYKIHTTDRFDEMRKDLLEQLKMVIDYDSAAFFLSSEKEGQIIQKPVTYNCEVNPADIIENLDFVNGKRLYEAKNGNYALEIILSGHSHFLGVITLFRSKDKYSFSQDDEFILDLLKDHLSYRLERHILGLELSAEKLTISEAVREFELSKREAMVLKELMAGKDNKIICEELFITTNTLKKHILNIYRKLGIKNRVQLFKLVRENEQ